MIVKCGRVLTKRGKVEYCGNFALFISPPGIFTKRIIPVCNRCRKDLIKVHRDHGRVAYFVDLVHGNTPASKETAK